MAPLPHISIIVGSTRPNRFSEKPAQWIFELAQKRSDMTTELLDLRDYPLPFYDEPTSPSMIKGEYPNAMAQTWARKIATSDGFIIVTPEYNHGYPAVLKNALDYVYREWNNKTVGFISYGGVGGARAIEQLRQVAVELQMAPIRTSIHIPWSTYMETTKQGIRALDEFYEKAEQLLTQLLWWAAALKAARAR